MYNVQVSKDHYYKGYDDLQRFLNYYYQIDLVKKYKPANVLEIGVGNHTVSNYLKNMGFKVDTCDFDQLLAPDFVADIRDLPFKDKSYDLLMACEVLEHIPWQEVDKALFQIKRVTKRYAIVSVPYSSLSFEFILSLPLFRRLFKRKYLSLFFRVPLFFKTLKFNGEHYWEMGRKGYSIGEVRKKFKEDFKIIQEFRPVLNDYHYFFVLEVMP